MTIKETVILILAALILGLTLGRLSVNKTVTTTKTDTAITTDATDHKVTVIVKKPGGEETTTITEDSKDDTKKTIDKDAVSTIIAPVKPRYNVSALVAIDHLTDLTPKYGISVSKEFIGLRVGAFGLTNGTAGVSLGIDF